MLIKAPVLTAELEDTTNQSDRLWYAKALRELAQQLTVSNDYYYPLIGAAMLIEEGNKEK